MTKPATRTEASVAGTQAISRAFRVLHLFRDRRTEIGVVSVAKELDLTLSTAHRLIRVLIAEGYLRQNEATDRYYLGSSAVLLGQAAQQTLGLDSAAPLLQKLRDETGESVNLGILTGIHATVALRAESPQALRFSQRPGDRIRLHATSIGKAILAFNDQLLETYLEQMSDWVRPTPKTIAKPAALRKELGVIRTRGWSKDDEESVLGVRCVGAPVVDQNGVAHAGVALQVPAVRMPDDRFEKLAPLVVDVADKIARLMPRGQYL
jgi:IclR family transcriptional regulator, acetate operon repressor